MVLIAIPKTTVAPNAMRLLAAAPVENSNGMTPNTKASEVIKIGRSRPWPASVAESWIDLPAAR